MEVPEAGVYDVATLRKMYNGNDALVERTVRVFRGTIQSDILELNRAWLAKDEEAIHNQVHKMRPNARLLGAHTLTGCLDLISRASHEKNAFELELALGRIRREANALETALGAYLNEAPDEK